MLARSFRGMTGILISGGHLLCHNYVTEKMPL
jgi:hypothetical protein